MMAFVQDILRADPAFENIERTSCENADFLRKWFYVSELSLGSGWSSFFGFLPIVWCFFRRNHSGILQEIRTRSYEQNRAFLLKCFKLVIRKWIKIDPQRLDTILKKTFSFAETVCLWLLAIINYIDSKIKEFFSLCFNFLLKFTFFSKIHQLSCDIDSFIEFFSTLTVVSWEVSCFYHYEWTLEVIKILGLPGKFFVALYIKDRILPPIIKCVKKLFRLIRDMFFRTDVRCLFVLCTCSLFLYLFYNTVWSTIQLLAEIIFQSLSDGKTSYSISHHWNDTIIYKLI